MNVIEGDRILCIFGLDLQRYLGLLVNGITGKCSKVSPGNPDGPSANIPTVQAEGTGPSQFGWMNGNVLSSRRSS